DDDGQTWSESATKLISPCYAGFNGSNEGACEPAIERLADGRIWMLMRTQSGFLYESFSGDNGATWQQAMASRFNTSTGPPNILRHRNGWLVACWNNCEMPPRAAGQGVYGGRDALHIAVSDDEGKTWRSFREIYLDHRRHDNPASTGDRGTAYPLGAYDAEGKIIVLAGQGAGGRNPIIVDPQWIVEKEAFTDFSDGLKQWSVYKQHGPAKGWWRARAVGCELMANPADPSTRCLHVRKADDLPADGAVWNFPNGWKGSLTARVMLRKGSLGGSISLNDRMFDPANDYGEELAVFRADLGADGRVGDAVLQPDHWHEVTLKWDLKLPECQVMVDGMPAGKLSLRNATLNGISYVRFRSAAKEIDTAGLLVGSVRVSIDDPYAPPCSPQDQIAHEKRYIERIVPFWTKDS
ncbi:MAG: exo-alpha-sialidase, partial [Planctomycetes bacterium]|nr:exo-alpha-sialidase [Planctomycetota bacterium]